MNEVRRQDDYCALCRLKVAWWIAPVGFVHVYPLAQSMLAWSRKLRKGERE